MVSWVRGLTRTGTRAAFPLFFPLFPDPRSARSRLRSAAPPGGPLLRRGRHSGAVRPVQVAGRAAGGDGDCHQCVRNAARWAAGGRHRPYPGQDRGLRRFGAHHISLARHCAVALGSPVEAAVVRCDEPDNRRADLMRDHRPAFASGPMHRISAVDEGSAMIRPGCQVPWLQRQPMQRLCPGSASRIAHHGST